MKNPNILIIGIGGVYNYGCEAIVRGTEVILRSEYPDARIIYASQRPEDDHKRLHGSQIEIVPRKFISKYSFTKIAQKFGSYAGINWNIRNDSLSLLKGVDTVLSIGGDIYTLYSNGTYSMSFPKFGDASLRKGIPYVLWSASVGPFSENPAAEKAYTKHLKKVSLITAREQETSNYLRKLGIYQNVVPCADPAYIVAPEIKAEETSMCSDLTIGINLSPLSTRFSKYSVEESYRSQARAIEGLIKTFTARIILIPHVVCDFNEADDDRRYLQNLQQAIASKYRKRVSLLDNDLGFVRTKRELIKCNIIIAARMHCAINALAAHIPTILVSYSRKAVGMCRYVYGNEDWVIPIDQFASKNVLESKIRSILGQRSAICKYLSNRIMKIQNEAYIPLENMKSLLSE